MLWGGGRARGVQLDLDRGHATLASKMCPTEGIYLVPRIAKVVRKSIDVCRWPSADPCCVKFAAEGRVKSKLEGGAV